MFDDPDGLVQAAADKLIAVVEELRAALCLRRARNDKVAAAAGPSAANGQPLRNPLGDSSGINLFENEPLEIERSEGTYLLELAVSPNPPGSFHIILDAYFNTASPPSDSITTTTSSSSSVSAPASPPNTSTLGSTPLQPTKRPVDALDPPNNDTHDSSKRPRLKTENCPSHSNTPLLDATNNSSNLDTHSSTPEQDRISRAQVVNNPANPNNPVNLASTIPAVIRHEAGLLSSQIKWVEECRRVADDATHKREEVWRVSTAGFHERQRLEREEFQKKLLSDSNAHTQTLNQILNEVKAIGLYAQSMKWETPSYIYPSAPEHPQHRHSVPSFAPQSLPSTPPASAPSAPHSSTVGAGRGQGRGVPLASSPASPSFTAGAGRGQGRGAAPVSVPSTSSPLPADAGRGQSQGRGAPPAPISSAPVGRGIGRGTLPQQSSPLIHQFRWPNPL